MTTPALAAPRRRARLARYALWQAADFGINVAIIETVIFALLGVTFIMNMHVQEAFLASLNHAMQLGQKLSVFGDLFSMFSSVAPMIALSGIVSTDRTNGYTGFLFAKPLARPSAGSCFSSQSCRGSMG